jgi:hypothetical protein
MLRLHHSRCFTGGAEPVDLFTTEFLTGLSDLLKPDGAIAVVSPTYIRSSHGQVLNAGLRTTLATFSFLGQACDTHHQIHFSHLPHLPRICASRRPYQTRV